MLRIKPAAVIFDMDGTLLDSEQIAWQSFRLACAAFDLPAEIELFHRCIGSNGQRTREIVGEVLGPVAHSELFWGRWLGAYKEMISDGPIPHKDGAREILLRLQKLQIPCAVATSTRINEATTRLRDADLLDAFEFVIGGDEVEESKPHPQIYQKAAQRIGQSPQHCLAIEDSATGLRSAAAAGMTVVHIPDMLPVTQDLLSELSALIVDDLHELAHHIQQISSGHVTKP